MSDGVVSLRRVLLEPSGGHLDDEMLAVLTTLEAAGEDIAQLYPSEVYHLETCVPCSEAYAQLMELTLAAVGDMEAAAEQYDPRLQLEQYVQHTLQAEFQATPNLKQELGEWLDALPTILGHINAEQVEQALPTTGPWTPLIRTRLAQALNQRLTWLRDYVFQAAQVAWNQAFAWQGQFVAGWYQLTLQPLPAKTIPVLSTHQTDVQREVVATRTPGPLGLNIAITMQATDDLGCRVVVTVDRPGLSEVAGRRVQLRYSGVEQTATTDERGVAEFQVVPIAALPHLQVMIQVS